MKQIVRPVRGTRDFYPEQMAFRQWLYARMKEVSQRFGYQEYDGPFLETLDLYAAKSGEELVNEQSYVFSDRGGDQITLRPELTPTLARMVAQKQRELPKPIRWFSFGPFWRYERPQKGRTREFFQWNVDIIGVDSPYADAEIVAVLAEFLHDAPGSSFHRYLASSKEARTRQHGIAINSILPSNCSSRPHETFCGKAFDTA